jgi:hypothetical protein
MEYIQLREFRVSIIFCCSRRRLYRIVVGLLETRARDSESLQDVSLEFGVPTLYVLEA